MTNDDIALVFRIDLSLFLQDIDHHTVNEIIPRMNGKMDIINNLL